MPDNTTSSPPPNPVSSNFFTSKPFIILVLTALALCGGIMFFQSLAEKTTLSFEFSLDGKGLPAGKVADVKVDGQPFTSGSKIKIGRHTLTAQLKDAEPVENRYWVLFGAKNLGTLPLESSKGSLLVSVTPSPATVVVQRTGQTVSEGPAPLTLDKLTVGNYSLTIKRGEYEENRAVVIQRQQRTEEKVDLNLGNVSLSSDPADAEFDLSGFDLSGNERHWRGKLPMHIDDVPAGDYSVVVHRGEYAERHPVKIQRQQLTESKIELNLGSVSLSSDPADAEFDLSGNGRHWQGKLPMRIDDVPGGNYSFLARRKGWELSADVLVSRGSIATNKTEFQYGSINVTSEPTGLAVSTNGVEIGKTPTTLRELKPGQYELMISDGENDLMTNVIVAPKEAAKQAFKLRYGTVQLASAPAGATVIRKGKEAGKTPLKLERIPAGETTVELRLEGFVTTNFAVHVVEGETANLTAKLISERYLEAMKQARTAFDSEKFTESKKLVASALEAEPNDPLAIRLRDEVLQAEKKTEDAVKEAEKKAEDARKEAEERVNRANEETRRKEFAEQAAQKRKAFEDSLSGMAENEFFEFHTREFPYSFETVWQAATTILTRKDKTATGDRNTGVLAQRMLYSPKKGILNALLGPGDDRSHRVLITPVDREITRVELKLFNYELVALPDLYAQEKTQQGQPYKFVQIGSFTFGLVLDKDLVRRRAAEFFDEVEKTVRPSGVAPVAQNSSEKKPSVPDSLNQATIEAREVLEKVIAAYGGKERFRRVAGDKTVKEGDLYSDGVNKVKYSVISEYRKPGYLRQEYVINRISGKESQVTEANNQMVVSTRNGRAVPLDELSRQEWINRAKESRTLLEELEDPKSVVTLLPQEVENASTVRVRSSNPDGDETIHHIDKSSWLIVKSEGASVLNSKRVKVVTEFSDFMEFDGIKKATHEVIYYDNVKKADLRLTQCRYFFTGPE
jgi:hypothetical protein